MSDIVCGMAMVEPSRVSLEGQGRGEGVVQREPPTPPTQQRAGVAVTSLVHTTTPRAECLSLTWSSVRRKMMFGFALDAAVTRATSRAPPAADMLLTGRYVFQISVFSFGECEPSK